VLAHGWNAVSYQILNPGMRHWFAGAGDAVVGYVVAAGTRVVAGAPVAPAERLAAAAGEFAADARRAGERVVYFGAGHRLERALAAAGAHAAVPLGAQPWWDPRAWDARRVRSLRAQLNRARNKGVRVAEWPAARARAHPALRAVLAAWLAGRGLPPLHFLVESETLDRLDDRRVFVAERGAGAGGPAGAVAFLVATPVPARGAWLLEQWPRVPDAPNGTVELLVDAAMRALGASGARAVTMGLAPLSRRAAPAAAAGPPPAWLAAALAFARLHGRRFYDFDGLDAFKAKFRPDRWEAISAIADAPRFPPRALWAIAGAFSQGSPAALVGRAVAMAARAEAARARRALARRAAAR
jgi:phosphatidylglycerol lysyltransferase